MTASTALEARKALATCWVAGNAESTLHAPTSPTSAIDDTEEEAERRAPAGCDGRVPLREPAS